MESFTGLSLSVLDSDPGGVEEPEEIAEREIGRDSDFGCFRDTIARHPDSGSHPIRLEHSDCDGEWPSAEIPRLEEEPRTIGAAFQKLPPEEPIGAFEPTAEDRAGAGSLYECSHNVDGEDLFEAVLESCAAARERGRLITFMQGPGPARRLRSLASIPLHDRAVFV